MLPLWMRRQHSKSARYNLSALHGLAACCAGPSSVHLHRPGQCPNYTCVPSSSSVAHLKHMEGSAKCCFSHCPISVCLQIWAWMLSYCQVWASQIVKEAGGSYLEAPVSGSKQPAEQGALIFLCGGDQALFDQAGPLLDVMGKAKLFLGNVRSTLLSTSAPSYSINHNREDTQVTAHSDKEQQSRLMCSAAGH